VARIIAAWLSGHLSQQVVVENRPGANTNAAAQAVISSPPDGYTLLWIGISNAINATLYESLPFDVRVDIAPVAGLVVYPLVLEVHPSVQVKTVAELITFAKANPGRLNMGSFGVGSISHVAGELFKGMTGISAIHIPYRGAAPMITDLLGGQVQVAIDTVAASLPHIRSGALRALAVTTTNRLTALPDVPTVAETIPDYEAVAWSGIAVPRATPPAVIEKLNREINACLMDPGTKARLAELTTVPLVFTPVEFGTYMVDEIQKWGRVIRTSKIEAE